MKNERLELLDYARLIAAVAVMAFHYGLNGFTNGKIEHLERSPAVAEWVKYGYLGVEFFFMISGFVIYRSIANKTPGQFVASRALRIFPAFWISVLITTAFSVFLGNDTMAVTAEQVLVNLTMIPEVFGVQYVDGVYWTLQLELAFYLAILLLMLTGNPKIIAISVLLWPMMMLIALLLEKWYWPFLGGYYAFFAAGAVIALHHDGAKLKTTATPLFICIGLCIESATRKAPNLTLVKGVVYEPWVIAILILLMFGFFLCLKHTSHNGTRYFGSRLAGALTYPLYLLHAHIGYMLISALSHYQTRWLVYSISVAAVFILAYVVHFFIEVRCKRVWRRLFDVTLQLPIDRAAVFAKAKTSSSNAPK